MNEAKEITKHYVMDIHEPKELWYSIEFDMEKDDIPDHDFFDWIAVLTLLDKKRG